VEVDLETCKESDGNFIMLNEEVKLHINFSNFLTKFVTEMGEKWLFLALRHIRMIPYQDTFKAELSVSINELPTTNFPIIPTKTL